MTKAFASLIKNSSGVTMVTKLFYNMLRYENESYLNFVHKANGICAG